jgi:hypothetical protein
MKYIYIILEDSYNCYSQDLQNTKHEFFPNSEFSELTFLAQHVSGDTPPIIRSLKLH